MRAVLLSLLSLLALAGCFEHGSELTSAGDDGFGGAAPPLAACNTDDECVPAAATCCECPTFATSIFDPKVDACDAIDCGPSNGPPGDPDGVCPTNVAAICDPQIHECVLACQPLACLDCPDGYLVDPNGCLSCTCAPPPQTPPQCIADADCVRVRADCCGCDNGGEDTAVPVTDAAGFDAGLACPTNPQCPGIVNQTCDPAAEARCIQGACVLSEPVPPDACGRPDLPACPTGTTCTINVNDSASLYGLGVCRP